MTEYLLQADQEVFLFFNGIHSLFWDKVLFMFSGKFVWVPMYLTMLAAFYRAYNWRVATVWVLTLAVAIVIADQGVATVIRPWFERLRPSHPEQPFSELVHIVNEYRGGRYGFPSCHAANSFALAMLIALVWRGVRMRWFIFLWAFMNSYSRLYLGVHYPGDLLVGCIIGCLVGWAMYSLGNVIVRRVAYRARVTALPHRRWFILNGRKFSTSMIDLSLVIGIITTLEILLIATD